MSARRLRRAGAVAGLAAAGYLLVVRPWQLRWGATAAEAAQPLPGDESVWHPQLRATRAIDVAAPPAAVWPWLVQMGGYTRAGWYSYDHLDNDGRRSADTIVPELQDLRVGDVLPTAPDGTGYTVEQLEPARHLVMAVHHPDVAMSVTFALRPAGGEGTRLLVRMRLRTAGTPRGVAYRLAADPGDFVMTRRMMRGIKRRAERTPI